MPNPRHPWIEKAARAGFLAKGVVYALIGGLAVTAVVGSVGEGSVGGGRNAVRTLGQQPFGQLLLVLTGIGLFAYALWRFVQAGFDPELEDTAGKRTGKIKRAGYVASGIVHVMLGIAALQMATGGGGGSERRTTYVRELLTVDVLGPVLIGAAGIFLLGFAAHEGRKAYAAKFAKRLKSASMSSTTRTWVIRIGRLGLGARAVVFAIIAIGLLRAGASTDPSKVEGVGGALHTIARQPFGAVLLIVVAGGLAAYGAYQVALARYRQVPAR